MNDLCVSIVSYNTKVLLSSCLDNLINLQKVREDQIWVFDNNSSDKSSEMIEKQFPKINLTKNRSNIGFSKGHNRMIENINSTFIVFLNPDTDLEKDAIFNMTKFMEKTDSAISSCKILDYNGSLQPNGGDLPLGMALISWLLNLESLGIKLNFHRGDRKYYESVHEVGWVAGTFMVVREDVFRTIGLLNEDYFMYFEDVEFCYRAKKAGFKIMINPKIWVKHRGGASSKDPSLAQWRGEVVNLIKFYKSNFSFMAVFWLRVLIYYGLFFRMLAFGLLGKLKIASTYKRIIHEI